MKLGRVKRYLSGGLILGMVAWGAVGCNSSSSSGGDAGSRSLAVVNTRLDDDANISLVNFKTGEVEKDLLDVAGPCFLAQHGAYVYVVDKTANKIIKWNPKTRTAEKDLSTGDSSKPYSVCFASDTKGYVALNGVSQVFVFNPQTMEKIDEIDLSSLEAADKKLQAYYCRIKDGKLFVTLRQNTRNSEKTSSLAVINVADDTLVTELTLATDGVSAMGQDAIGGKARWSDAFSGDMYVAVVNSMTKPDDGAIERVVDTDTDHPTSSVAYNESEFYGSLAMWVFDTPTTGWAITGVKPSYSLVHFDLAAGGFTKAPVFQDTLYSYAMDLSEDGLLLVGSKEEDNPGIWVYDTKDNYKSKFSKPLNVGLLPNRILVIK